MQVITTQNVQQTLQALDLSALLHICTMFAAAGIVNAVEVVNSFTGDDALMDFRRWVLAPDTDAIKAAAKKGKGRGRKKSATADDEGGCLGSQAWSLVPAADCVPWRGAAAGGKAKDWRLQSKVLKPAGTAES